MQKITAELLGSGRILLDGKQVNLPFKQAEALVYYLLVEKETFRPKLADIIWGDSADEHKVQSNMRNAIYVIRREFGRDFLVGASKNVIQINPEIRIDLDIDRFNDKNLTDFSFYAGDFLENFYLKDNEYYNEWLLNNPPALSRAAAGAAQGVHRRGVSGRALQGLRAGMPEAHGARRV